MAHGLLERLNWPRRSPLLQCVPILDQFILMHFGPSFNQAPLPAGKRAGNHLDGLDGKDPYFLLIVGMKVRDVMLCTYLREHPYDDAEESAYLGHQRIVTCETVSIRVD